MPTSRRDLLNLAAFTALLCSSTSLSATLRADPGVSAAPRPNIVVILVDDMGFSDVGCYGSEIPTPNIDALAAGGLRFTQFYNTPRCSPSRAALLTGTYPHQAGLGHLESFVVPGSRGLFGKLDNRVVTLAEVLRSAGYHTSVAGKWHLGMTHGVGPWQRGFDRSLVSPVGEIYFPDQTTKNAQQLYLDGRALPTKSPEIGSGEWYSSDMFADWAAKFALEAQEHNKPFLIYLPFVSAHFPLMATPDEIARFRGHYTQNWDKMREARLARQKALKIVSPEQRLPPRLPNTYDWEKLSPAERDRFDQHRHVARDVALDLPFPSIALSKSGRSWRGGPRPGRDTRPGGTPSRATSRCRAAPPGRARHDFDPVHGRQRWQRGKRPGRNPRRRPCRRPGI